MTVKELMSQIELLYGRQPHMYLKRLINDGLLDMSAEIQHYKANAQQDLIENQRWYGISDVMIDIERVEILNSDTKYEVIPIVSNPGNVLEGDTH
jgi:hypothetical protein